MEYVSVFEMLKIGVGPSSSHTLGPWRAAEAFLKELRQRQILEKVQHVRVDLYGSLSLTGKGHATDLAAMLGLSGTDPEYIPVDSISTIISQIGKDKKLHLAGERFIDFDPACVIALGGGSSIDACKGILYFAYKLYKKLSINKEKLFFVAIPTTSGTGSEVTSYSVVTQGEHKIALANDLMLPDVALLSTKFLSALPAKVVADTGMDVLTHALEAYVSTNANPFASALAIKSIKLIFENLVTHYNDRKIEGAKENVQFASCLAGIAFDNSSLGINHSIAHSIGAKFHIAHGRANAIVMPYVIEVNTEANKKYCEVSRELGLPAGNVEEGKSSLLSFVRILKEKLGIEKCLKDYGVDFEEFRKEIPDILLDIKKDMCTVYNPNKLTNEEYIRLLLKIYFGE